MKYTLTLTTVIEWRTGYAAKYGDLPNNRKIETILVATAMSADILWRVADDLQKHWNKGLTAKVVDLDGNPVPRKPATKKVKVKIGNAHYNIDADLVDHPYVDEVSDE